MNYSSANTFPDASPFPRLCCRDVVMFGAHTVNRAPRVPFPVMWCLVEWMNAENTALNSFAVCSRFWFMMSWRATSGNYTCISPHSAGNSPPLTFRALRLPRSLELTCAVTVWKTIGQPQGRLLEHMHKNLTTYCFSNWPYVGVELNKDLLPHWIHLQALVSIDSFRALLLLAF